MQIDGFDIFAFVVMGVLVAAVVLAIVALGSLPGKIAAASASSPCRRRQRRQLD